MRREIDETYAKDAVNDAELVITEAIKAGVYEQIGRPAEVRAHEIAQALDKAGFEIRYTPLDLVTDTAERLTWNLDGYANAMRLIRNGRPSATAVAQTLGPLSPDGPQGNVWTAFDRRHRTFRAEPVDCPPAFKQVILALEGANRQGRGGGQYDAEASARCLMGDLARAGIGVFPIESYDPARLKEAADAGVVAIGERPLNDEQAPRIVLGPGKIELRLDAVVVAVFYDDGFVSFSGDAADMVAFRDMAAKIVGVPGSREAA